MNARESGRRWPSPWLLTAAGTLALIYLAQVVIPVPYVIERPGPVYDTLGTVRIDGEEQPLIGVPEGEGYPTEGQLNLLTVSIVGSPEQSVGWFGLVPALLDPAQDIVPMEQVFPAGVSGADRDEANQQLMTRSQADATAAALRSLGHAVTGTISVGSVAEQSPAAGLLEAEDVIERVNGEAVTGYEQLRRLIEANGAERPARIEVRRGGEPVEVAATPVPAGEGGPLVLGVGVTTAYDFPVDVTLRIDQVGGPSAGLMFALGINDTLTPGPLTGGHVVSGTGTIDGEGVVGPIGGLPQKIVGAANAGSELFLMPTENCAQLPKTLPDGLTVAPVATLQEALAAVETFANGGTPSGIETCDTGSSHAATLS